jgi:uncharacterized membrane protein (DUF2068 family)
LSLEARVRPSGVVAIAMLDSIGGVLSIVLGLYFLSATSELVQVARQEPGFSSFGADALASAIDLVAASFSIVGLLVIVDAYGLLKGRRWAWWMALILALVGAISSLLGLPWGVVGLGVELLIVYYLTRRNARDYFRPISEAVPIESV